MAAEARRNDPGFARPIRYSYKHIACGRITRINNGLATRVAYTPGDFTHTLCGHCGALFPIGQYGEFVWIVRGKASNIRVGT